MKAMVGGADSAERYRQNRRRLLAKVHIAAKDLDLHNRGLYRTLLNVLFGTVSAAGLTNDELVQLVRYFETEYGWKPKGRPRPGKMSELQVLRNRAASFACVIPGGEERARKLCRKFCGVDEIMWIDDTKRAKQFLAVIGNIHRREVKADTRA